MSRMSRHYWRARTKAGKACKAVAVRRGLCAFHADPQRAAQLGRMGGRKNRRYPLPCKVDPVPPPRTAREVKDLLAEALADIHAGRREPKVVSVMAYVGTALLTAIKTADMGEAQPFVESSYRIYGSHPDDVWPKIMAQRKAKLGWEFDLWYFENGTMKPDVIIPDYDPLILRKPPRRAEEFCIARLPSDAELEKVLRILPPEKAA